MTPTDAAILKHVVDIRGSRFSSGADAEGSHGYTVKFIFRPNSYFSETELSVRAVFSDEEETIIKDIEGSRISWSSNGAGFTVSPWHQHRY